MSRGDLSEVEWRILRVLLPVEREPGKRGRGRPPEDNRNIINGILWRLRTGAPWRDELPQRGIVYSLNEATVVIGQRRNHYNTIRPHSSLDYRPPAPRTSSPTMLHLCQSTAKQ